MRFQKTFYPYQNEILSVFESERKKWEKKIHIVAPPWSGKTILGCEMLSRISEPALILVPNLTLLSQWQDKIESLFFEESENADELISTQIDSIKKINILTYQSITGSDDEDDDIKNEIYNLWYESEKGDFAEKEIFFDFLNELKTSNPDEYQEGYVRQRKKIKNRGESSSTRKMMHEKVLEYAKKLKEYGVKTLIVDEAHHLTSWWSHVLFEIWNELGEPYIVWLTATPPFENVDYFELDESYTKLLGSVDYIVPTPAIVRSGRLAPYSDLLYIVSPDVDLENILRKREKSLSEFIEQHKIEIVKYLHEFLSENYENLKTKSWDMCDKWMRFIYVYKWIDINMANYIHGGISDDITLEDIAKSIGKWANDVFKKTKETNLLNEVKWLFYELWYIWRGANLYRFETPIEKWLIYAKSKQDGVREILRKEEQNLGENLRCAIITDFLDAESDWINCHSIFESISKDYSHLSPYIVSGQGIWKLENWVKCLTQNETILSVTEKLMRWEIKLVIGTRWILGEGWDCQKLNTLIDLTGVSAYMSVNQVHGRAIRLDPENPDKVANIYDIVCIWEGYQWKRDFERIIKKHAQFYGVDDAWLIIKWLDHIYPQLEKNVKNKEKINIYTQKKSQLRSMVKRLWNIGEEFKNEEIFSLAIEIKKPYGPLYIPNKFNLKELSILAREIDEKWNMLEFGKTKYHEILREWIKELLNATLQVLQPLNLLPKDFSYTLNWSPEWSITVVSKYHDPLVSKRFIEIIAPLFQGITNQKYVLRGKNILEDTIKKVNIGHLKNIYNFPYFVQFIFFFFVFSQVFVAIYIFFWSLAAISLLIISFFTARRILQYFVLKKEKEGEIIAKRLSNIASSDEIIFWLPTTISSNEEKRGYFIWEKYESIPKMAKWYQPIEKISIIKMLALLLLWWFLSVFLYGYFNSEILLKILYGIGFLIFWIILILFFLGMIHAFYTLYAIIGNMRKSASLAKPRGEIAPSNQSDIGKSGLFSVKIEKIWI